MFGRCFMSSVLARNVKMDVVHADGRDILL